MHPKIARFEDGHKFMWNGACYETREAAQAARTEYEANGFETRCIAEEDTFLVYSRRVVTEIVLEGDAPIG